MLLNPAVPRTASTTKKYVAPHVSVADVGALPEVKGAHSFSPRSDPPAPHSRL